MSKTPAKHEVQAPEGFEQIRRMCDQWLERLAAGRPGGATGAAVAQEQSPEASFEALLHPKTPRLMKELGYLLLKGLVCRLDESEGANAAQVAAGLLDDIRRRYGNETMYISSGHFEYSTSTKEDVVAEFNGTNALELARKHGISPRRVRQIAQQARRERLAKARGLTTR